MKNIIIGTTSINRSKLHQTNIPNWYKWINELDRKKYNLKWFINIDYIDKLDEEVEDTKLSYRSIITEIPITFLESEKGKGNFLNACKRVSSNIEKYVIENKLNEEDCIIIWLEDDWSLNLDKVKLSNIIENYLGNLSSINLTFLRTNYIHALAPSIISYKLWKQLHLTAWKNQNKQIDPEHCVGLYFLKNFMKYDDLLNITIINEYKKVDEKFFTKKFLNLDKSYYTYDKEMNNQIKLERFVEKHECIEFTKNKVCYLRITCGLCSDIGREFMLNLELKKDKNKLNFYD